MKKKKVFIVTSAITAAFMGAAHLEWVGYKYFDRENGDNLLCKADPGCRHLTAEETKMAQQYFGDQIKYKKPKIFNRRFMYVFGQDRTGLSPNGNIYFPEKEHRSPNFANDNSWHKKLFMHEMTHVAQYQSGMNIPQQALLTWLKHAFRYGDAYEYNIDNSHAYADMNLEQQAQVMSDYFSLREYFVEMTTTKDTATNSGMAGRFPTFGNDWVKARCKELAPYEAKLSPIFPIKHDEMCQPPAKKRVFKLKSIPRP
jgi:hypothetical protein